MKPLFILTIILELLTLATSQTLRIYSPKELVQKFGKQIPIHISPLGFHPLAGQIYAQLQFASPQNACTKVQQVTQTQITQAIYLLADDQDCLDSVKSKNIAKANADGAIIIKNSSSSLHDRQIDIVHIPVIEIMEDQYIAVKQFMEETNITDPITVMIDFTHGSLHKKNILMQVFISPTLTEQYELLNEIKPFLAEQDIEFVPHYVLHSQSKSDKKYVGCYSSGKYCAPELQFEGKTQGQFVVAESLRQIIIWKMYGGLNGKWWDYIKYFTKQCLKGNENLWKTTDQAKFCSEKAMIMANIDRSTIDQAVSSSFYGPQPKSDNNQYLFQQRQAFVQQKISKYPVAMINKKQIQLDQNQIKNRICQLQDPDKITQSCKNLLNITTITAGQIIFGFGLLVIIMALIAVAFRWFIGRKMKRQMQDQVNKTLEQYYRYIDNYQAKDAVPPQYDSGIIESHANTQESEKKSNVQIKKQEIQLTERKKEEEANEHSDDGEKL